MKRKGRKDGKRRRVPAEGSPRKPISPGGVEPPGDGGRFVLCVQPKAFLTFGAQWKKHAHELSQRLSTQE